MKLNSVNNVLKRNRGIWSKRKREQDRTKDEPRCERGNSFWFYTEPTSTSTVAAHVSSKFMQPECMERVEVKCVCVCMWVCVEVVEDFCVCPEGFLIHALAYSSSQMRGYVTAEAD